MKILGEVNNIHECEICGHKGEDVEWLDNPYKSGYFCKDQEACFQRYKIRRNTIDTFNTGDE